MHKKTKILHYIGSFSHLPETFIYDLLNRLTEFPDQSHEVLCHSRINEDARPFPSINLVPVNQSVISKIGRRLTGGKWQPLEAKGCKQVISEKQPDLIHAHFGPNGLRMGRLLLKMRSNIPLAVHCHGTDILSLPFKDKVYLEQLQRVAHRAHTLFIANTQFLADAMVAVGVPREKIRIVHYSVNEHFVAPPSVPKGRGPDDDGRFRVIAVGRFIRWKGHRFLLEGFSRFLKKKPASGTTLTLVGDGPERKDLRNLVSRLGIQDNVSFTGALSHGQVADLLEKHDLLIQPSIIDPETRQCESFGMTILEAIAKGLPVVVTRTGGMPELVGEDTPWSRMIEPASAQAIATVIDEFVSKRFQRFDNSAYAASRLSHFSSNKQMSALQAVYEELTGGR